MKKNPLWSEFGDNLIPRHIKRDTVSKLKLITKYKSTLFSQFSILYTGEKFDCFINLDNTIKKNSINNGKSLLSSLYFNYKSNYTLIIAIDEYKYNEKCKLNFIETYDIIGKIWFLDNYKDLKFAKSQVNTLLYNENSISVFGGYN